MSVETSSASAAPGVNWWRRLAARIWLGVSGWTVEGGIPSPRVVLIAAPHTTNWDFPHTLAAAWSLGMPIHWLGKDSLFRPPWGTILRWLGGIPVDRSASRGMVGQMADRFARADCLIVAVPPSGTRSNAGYWRSGFYWIARGAGVPLVCCYLDYPNKRANVGLSFVPTGDIRSDMDRIRDFYQGIEGKRPGLATPIRLREEDDASVASEGAAPTPVASTSPPP